MRREELGVRGEELGEATPGVCARCGTELMDGRCPACFERLAAEEAGFAADDGDLPDEDFCPEGD